MEPEQAKPSDAGRTDEPGLVAAGGGECPGGLPTSPRGLTPQELGIRPYVQETERTGFIVGGVNSSDLIRRLPSINAMPIAQLEAGMRPDKLSMGGFLGRNESLLSVLAADNDFVLGKGLTHQQLAEPLQFALACPDSHFTWRGTPMVAYFEEWRGSQSSPFNDGTQSNRDVVITNLDTGHSLSCACLLPDMIERYGFYEGRGTPYRLEPQDVISTFELDSESRRAKEQDPVAKLSRERESAVSITTFDQISRMAVLSRNNVNVFAGSNYTIQIESSEMLIRTCFAVANGSIPGRVWNRAQLGMFPTTPLSIVAAEALINRVLEKLPSRVQEAAVASIGSITFGRQGQSDEAGCLANLFSLAFVDKTSKGTAARALLEKIVIDKSNVEIAVAAFSEVVRKATDNHAQIIDALDNRFPSLRSLVIGHYKTTGVELSPDTSLSVLFTEGPKHAKFAEDRNENIKFARRVGQRIITEPADMTVLMNIMSLTQQGQGQRPSDAELASLNRMDVDPALIPIAAGMYRDRDSAINQLFNGAAKKKQEIEQLLQGLPANTAEGVKLVVRTIVTAELNSSLSSFPARNYIDFIARHSELTEKQAMAVYVSGKAPSFAAVLRSDLVNYELNSGWSNPVKVSIAPAAVNALPTHTRSDLVHRGEVVHIARLGNDTFEIGEHEIVLIQGVAHGSPRLTVRDGVIYLNEGTFY